MKIFPDKLTLRQLTYVLLAVGYTLLFILIYVLHLHHVYSYFHFGLIPRNPVFIIFSVLLAVAPIVFYDGQKSISSYIAVIIYLLTYVPTIITFMFSLERSLIEIVLAELCFAVAMILLLIADR